MNIFILHKCPVEAAQMHIKKHNPKMLIEALQIYSTLLRKQGETECFLDKSIRQGGELILWLEKDYRNLNWFKMFIDALFYIWTNNTTNKNIERTKLYKKYGAFMEAGYLEQEEIIIPKPKSFIFRGMECYSFPDLQHKEECYDIDRVVENYREFYKWKLKNQNMKVDFYVKQFDWINDN